MTPPGWFRQGGCRRQPNRRPKPICQTIILHCSGNIFAVIHLSYKGMGCLAAETLFAMHNHPERIAAMFLDMDKAGAAFPHAEDINQTGVCRSIWRVCNVIWCTTKPGPGDPMNILVNGGEMVAIRRPRQSWVGGVVRPARGADKPRLHARRTLFAESLAVEGETACAGARSRRPRLRTLPLHDLFDRTLLALLTASVDAEKEARLAGDLHAALAFDPVAARACQRTDAAAARAYGI